MPLARIISRTPQCWRELAVDLLARGYAVEIVSPDAIPDNFADLELRVDTDPPNDLTANITARDGGHSTSLDFVHHLRAPMEDFVRRLPKADGVASYSGGSVNLNAEQNLPSEIELPGQTAGSQKTPVITSLPEAEEGARLIGLPEEASPTAPEPKRHPKTGITIVFHRSRSKQKAKSKTSRRFGGWFLRTSAGFAAVVGLGALLVTGTRGKESLVQNVSADSPKVVSVDKTSSSSPDLQRATTAAENSTAGLHDKNRSVHQTSPKAYPSRGNAKREAALGKANGLPAEQATIYRDKPAAKTVSRTRRNKRHPRRDETVAQDTVTYLDRKDAPKNRVR